MTPLLCTRLRSFFPKCFARTTFALQLPSTEKYMARRLLKATTRERIWESAFSSLVSKQNISKILWWANYTWRPVLRSVSSVEDALVSITRRGKGPPLSPGAEFNKANYLSSWHQLHRRWRRRCFVPFGKHRFRLCPPPIHRISCTSSLSLSSSCFSRRRGDSLTSDLWNSTVMAAFIDVPLERFYSANFSSPIPWKIQFLTRTSRMRIGVLGGTWDNVTFWIRISIVCGFNRFKCFGGFL